MHMVLAHRTLRWRFLLAFAVAWNIFVWTKLVTPLYWTFFAVIFGVPAAILLAWAIYAVLGHTTIDCDAERLSVFTGLGPIGFRREARWREIRSVEQCESNFRSRNQRANLLIQVSRTNARPMRFGSLLADEDRAAAIREIQRRLS